jgi:AraC-like DNA-binding protein
MKEPTSQMCALSSLDKEFMDRAMGIIEKNVANSEFNISMLVKEMGVGRTVLFNKLRTIVGQSPNDYIITVRLKKAISLLENNPELNITEISEMTGFNYVGYFGRVFKERYKMTPSDYRNMKKTKEK